MIFKLGGTGKKAGARGFLRSRGGGFKIRGDGAFKLRGRGFQVEGRGLRGD